MIHHQNSPEYADANRIMPRIVLLSLAFLLATIVIFVVYRIAFVHLFVASASGGAWKIHFSGLRLEIALVALELLVLTLIFLTFRVFRLRRFAAVLCVMTILHVGLAMANLLFFKERDQHLWEMLIANVSSPREIVVAVEPFVETNPFQFFAVLALLTVLTVCAVMLCLRIPPLRLDLWRPRRHLLGTLAISLICLVVTLDPIGYQQAKYWKLGWIPSPTVSHYYMRFGSYNENQAVVNPVHDLFRSYLPATLASLGGVNAEHVDLAEAASVSASLLGVRPVNSDYPMLQNLPAGPQLGLKNVVVIVVEGLSGSILNRQENGEEITPFLNDLARRGLYYPNFFQSYNATDGSVLSVVTGMYKSFANQNWRYFLPTEVNGYFGSIAYLLGKEKYKHFAMFGFQNRREDFSAFLRNQGFNTFDITNFEASSGGKIDGYEEASNSLGLFDHVLFGATEKTLPRDGSPFTALAITATTHSPWAIPKSKSKTFSDGRLNTFRYIDDSIKNFVNSLKERPNGLDDTLLVITGDHTSIAFTRNLIERLRVPLIFYNPRLEPLASQLNPNPETMGSHVDILPTILQLLDGVHPYSGMGVSLISPTRSNARVISGSRFHTFYLRDQFALLYSPSMPDVAEVQLFAIKDGDIVADDVSSLHPDVKQRMQREFFSLYETSSRLIKEKRVIPNKPDGLRSIGGPS